MSWEFKSVFKEDIELFIKFKRSGGLKYEKEVVYLRRIDAKLCELSLTEKEISADTFDYLSQPTSTNTHNYAILYYILKDLCRFLQSRGYQNIYCEERNFKVQRNHIPVIFSRDEMFSIIRAADQIASQRKSDKLYRKYYGSCIVLRLLYGCGLRISEALKLKLEDCALHQGTVYIYNSKRNVSRLIVISDSLKECLERYVEYFNIQSGLLFVNSNEGQLSAEFFRNFYHSVLEKLGYEKSIRVHDLRHTFTNEALSQMIDAGYSEDTVLAYLSRYLGHNTISETEYYVHFTDRFKERMIQSNEQFSSYLYHGVLSDDE